VHGNILRFKYHIGTFLIPKLRYSSMDGASSSSESRARQTRRPLIGLLNGDSQLLQQEIAQTDKKRKVVDMSYLEPKRRSPKQRRKGLADERQARDPRDEAITPNNSRGESPFAQQRAIDFDGLSWPSKFN
jgi:hypothetical protein